MFTPKLPTFFKVIAAGLLIVLEVGCGGGGGAGLNLVGSGGTGSITGTVTKGPVNGASVMAYRVDNGQMGAQLGSAATDINGNYAMQIGAYSGPVMIRVTGGSYTDEATGTGMTMASGDAMTAVIQNVAAGATTAGIQVTPITSMAQSLALGKAGGMTGLNIAAANTAMGNYFAISDILLTPPMNPLMVGSGAAASADARNYGMTLAAMSQYAKSISMPNTSSLVTAFMSDASDGMMNGMSASGQIMMAMGSMMAGSAMAATAGTSGMATAMSSFLISPANKSGLTTTDFTTLMNRLSTTPGTL